MGKREKILVALMVAAILYGGFELLLLGLGGRTNYEAPLPKDPQAALEMARQVKHEMNDVALTPHQQYALEAAATNRQNDLFHVLSGIGPIAPEQPLTADEPVDFRYTGYLEIGGKRLAIINGKEYAEGDALDRKGFVLKRATPESVVIEAGPDARQVLVPYSE